MLLDTIKARIKSAMLSKNESERNILRVLLGEAQTFESRQGSIADEHIIKLAKKIITNNNESIGVLGKDDKRAEPLLKENEILSSLLPKEMTLQEIEAFLNGIGGNAPIGGDTDIRAAKNDGQAVGVAMKALKNAGLVADGRLVGEAVKKMRA